MIRAFALWVSVVALLTTNSCKNRNAVESKDELFSYLDSLERKYESACYSMGKANWNNYSGESAPNLDGAKARFARIFLDEQPRAVINEWRGKSASLADERLSRRLELWHRCFIGGSIYSDPEIAREENSLQKQITDFRFSFHGNAVTRAQISNRLREERDQRIRHDLWAVTGQLSSRARDNLIRLIKLRNERARELGFNTYYSLSLYLHAIDEGWLLGVLRMLEEQTRPAFESFINASKRKLHVKKFHPWDFDIALRYAVSLPDNYFRSNSVFSTLHRFEKSLGFPVDSLPIKEYVKDIPYGGLSLAISIPNDSRFLVNPTKGKPFYEVAIHEYGHSLKAVYTRVEEPILKGYEWIPGAQCAAYEEGVADLHKEFTDERKWLAVYTKAKPREIDKYIAGKGIPVLIRTRRLLKDFAVEYELYKNPNQDAAALERAMVKKYLMVDMDERDPHLFAANIWYTSYPCYFQNYILAGMIATQLQEALTNRFGEEKISNPMVSQWLIDHLYASGELSEWTERIREATGKSLETGAYLRKLGIAE